MPFTGTVRPGLTEWKPKLPSQKKKKKPPSTASVPPEGRGVPAGTAHSPHLLSPGEQLPRAAPADGLCKHLAELQLSSLTQLCLTHKPRCFRPAGGFRPKSCKPTRAASRQEGGLPPPGTAAGGRERALRELRRSRAARPADGTHLLPAPRRGRKKRPGLTGTEREPAWKPPAPGTGLPLQLGLAPPRRRWPRSSTGQPSPAAESSRGPSRAVLGSTGSLTLGPVHHLLRAPPGHRLHGGLGPAGTCPCRTPAPPLPQPARRAPPAADSPPLRLPSPRPCSPPAPRRPGRPPGPAPPAGRGRTRPAAAPPPGAAVRLPSAARSWPHGRRASARGPSGSPLPPARRRVWKSAEEKVPVGALGLSCPRNGNPQAARHGTARPGEEMAAAGQGGCSGRDRTFD